MQHRGNNERQILKDIKEAEEEKRQLAIIASEATKNRKSNWTKDGSVEEIQQRIDVSFINYSPFILFIFSHLNIDL